MRGNRKKPKAEELLNENLAMKRALREANEHIAQMEAFILQRSEEHQAEIEAAMTEAYREGLEEGYREAENLR